MKVKSLYLKNNTLYILNQKLLPHKIRYMVCDDHIEVAGAIREMIIRGAPAIGCAAAYGIYLASIEKKFSSTRLMIKHLEKAAKLLLTSRPTAVNLSWAVERMLQTAKINAGLSVSALSNKLLAEAALISEEDVKMNKSIGRVGANLLKKNSAVLTHCNAGALATAGYGTALGIIRTAFYLGKIKNVFVDETRPYLQGAKLTTWELAAEKIPHILLTDNMAGYFMSKGEVDAVIIGADRIASNGDTANKIGSYSLAVLCNYHKIPFYVAAPTSTIDGTINSGKGIPIEERPQSEVVLINGKLIAPRSTAAAHPTFDITPSKLISAIITERGISRPPYKFK